MLTLTTKVYGEINNKLSLIDIYGNLDNLSTMAEHYINYIENRTYTEPHYFEVFKTELADDMLAVTIGEQEKQEMLTEVFNEIFYSVSDDYFHVKEASSFAELTEVIKTCGRDDKKEYRIKLTMQDIKLTVEFKNGGCY